MEAYSVDLRRRVATAYDEGVETIEEVAERFGVSASFVSKVMARRRRTGSLSSKPHRGGFASALAGTPMEVLAGLVKTQPDATLEELRRHLAEQCAVSVSVSAVCRAVAKLQLPRKKSRCTPVSGTPVGCGPCVGPSCTSSAKCRPASGSTWTRAGSPRP